jgi:acyl carrier protein
MRDDVLTTLTRYLRDRLSADLAPTTPLVSSGLLKSLETARLLAFIQREYGVRIPATHLARRNFEDLDTVTDLVVSLVAAATPTR